MEPSVQAKLDKNKSAQSAAAFEPTKAASAVSAGLRILQIDALRGVAMIAMALDHIASFMLVSLQAESYGGLTAVLESWPHWVAGLFTNIAAPTFWLLSGISIVLLETSRKKKGVSDWKISQFLLIRAALIILIDLTICEITWVGKGPYTHVLLSIGISLMVVSLLRLLPTYVIAVVSVTMIVGYQIFLPQIASNFSQTTNFWQALAISYSTKTIPAIEFSLIGWGSLMGLGYALGKGIFAEENGKKNYMWVTIPGLLALWFVLRAAGGFGDLAPYSQSQPWYYFMVMSKTPPSLTYLAFNLGLAAIVFTLFSLRSDWLEKAPLKWLVLFGQVSLFFFIVHIGIYGLLAQGALELKLPVPGMALLFAVWIVGLIILLPINLFYRSLRKRFKILRYL